MSGHHHHGERVDYDRRFGLGVAINVGIVVMELVFGTLAGSLALVADAGHNLSDVLALVLAWGASRLARQGSTARHTYGLRRTTILASLANAVILLIAVGSIGWEAARRLLAPRPVEELTVVAVAAIGMALNAATAWLFLRDRHRDLNVRGAFQHMAGDALVSLGVLVSALVIRATGWTWLDPAVSLAIMVVITFATWGLLRESLNLALDAVPAGINPVAVEAYLRALPGVASVHDLHIWGMSTTEAALTAHVVKPDGRLDDSLVSRACHELHDRFAIEHVTLQLERGDADCPDCSPAVASS